MPTSQATLPLFLLMCVGLVACSDDSAAGNTAKNRVTPDQGSDQGMAKADMRQQGDLGSSDLSVPPGDMTETWDTGGQTKEDMPPSLDMMKTAVDMRQATPVDVKVATFNVELLFDTVCNSGSCGADDFEQVPTQAMLDQKVAALRRAIQEIDADILLLQEIETEAMMELLAQPLMSQYPTRVFGATSRSGDINVAIFSRGTYLGEDRHRKKVLFSLPDGQNTRFTREFLEVRTQLRGATVIAFTTHFISKFNPNNDPKRLAEGQNAAKIVKGVADAFPNALVIFGGDLNDTPDSPPLQALKSAGLVITGEGEDIMKAYTNRYVDTLQIIDHILYVDNGKVSVVPGSKKVFRDQGEAGLAGSDHASPSLILRLSP